MSFNSLFVYFKSGVTEISKQKFTLTTKVKSYLLKFDITLTLDEFINFKVLERELISSATVITVLLSESSGHNFVKHVANVGVWTFATK